MLHLTDLSVTFAGLSQLLICGLLLLVFYYWLEPTMAYLSWRKLGS